LFIKFVRGCEGKINSKTHSKKIKKMNKKSVGKTTLEVIIFYEKNENPKSKKICLNFQANYSRHPLRKSY